MKKSPVIAVLTLALLGASAVLAAEKDATGAENVDAVRAARFVYLAGASPMHLRSVLKDSPLWDAIVETWNGGAAIAGSSA